MIPAWVVKAFEKAHADALDGSVTVVFRSGEPKHIKREEVIQAPPPEPVQGRSLTPACPKGCGPMKEQDYGNLYVCACGTKRTRAQIQTR